jgi:tetraacyldisaccharide 4'-kinase
MRWFDPLLYPLAILYGAITDLRNHFFDIGLKKSINFTVPTIAVGNLSIGGTGKTPMVEFMIKSLVDQYKISVLSRGYGRKTKGFQWANSSSQPHEIGDEPLQIFSKFYPQINVAVCEDRVIAVPEILINSPETDVIFLDDAFQHRYLKADAYFLLTTFDQPFYHDSVLPLGKLREKIEGSKRADIVIVTKCPEYLSNDQRELYTVNIQKITKKNTPVLFSQIVYGKPYEISKSVKEFQNKIVLVSALADDKVLHSFVEKEYQLIHKFDFPDHHRYTVKDLESIKSVIFENSGAIVLTTEKDAVKLKNPLFKEHLKEIPIFALPIELKFNETDQNFLINFMNQIIEEKAYTREI